MYYKIIYYKRSEHTVEKNENTNIIVSVFSFLPSLDTQRYAIDALNADNIAISEGNNLDQLEA